MITGADRRKKPPVQPYKNWLALALALCLVCALLPAQATESKKTMLRVSYWAFNGYHNMADDGARSGYGYELLQLMARYANIGFTYHGYDLSFSENQRMLELGEIDLMTGVKKTRENLERFDFSSRDVGNASTIITLKAGNHRIISGQYDTYNGMTIGIVPDTARETELAVYARQKGFTYTTVYYGNSLDLSEALQKGEVDALVSSSLRVRVSEWTIDSFNDAPVYIAVRKGDEQTLKLVNHALERMEIEEQHWMTMLTEKYYGKNESNVPFFTEDERAFLSEQQQAGRVYRVLVNPDRKPYSYVKDGEMTGIMPDLFDMIARRAGISYEWIIARDREDYAQLIASPDTDICIDLSPDFYLAEQTGYSITDTYLSAPFSWIRRKDSTGDIKIAAKVAYTALTPAQYAYNSAYHDINYITYPTREECLRSVVMGITDGFCTYTYAAEQLVLDNPNNHLLATISQAENQFCIGISHGINGHLTSILNTTLNCLADWEVTDVIRRHATLEAPTYTLLQSLVNNRYLGMSAVLGIIAVVLLIAMILQQHHYQRFLKKNIRFLKKTIKMQDDKLDESVQAMINVLATAIEFRSCESGEHVLRIRRITRDVMKELNRLHPDLYSFTDKEIALIEDASVLHDVGKIAIPDYILNKPGKLTPIEYESIKEHPVKGCELLQRIPRLKDEPLYAYAYDICRWHHERWDGSGYPDGLKGEQIPIWAQAAAVADVFDALTSPRVYKAAYSRDEAIAMIQTGECGAFNPHVLTAFSSVAATYEDKKAEKPALFEQAPAGRDTVNLVLSAFQCLMNTTDDMVFLKDVDLVYRAASPAFAALLERTPEEVVCHTDGELFKDATLAQRYVHEDQKLLASGEDLVNYLEMLGERDGMPIYGSTTKRLLTDSQGRIMGILGITRDITSTYFSTKHHQMALKYLFELPEDAYFAVYVDLTLWRINVENTQAVRGVKFAPHIDIRDLAERAYKGIADQRGQAFSFYSYFDAESLRKVYESGQHEVVLEYLRQCPDGEIRWFHDEIRFLIDPSNGHLGMILSTHDIQQQKEEEKRIQDLAEHDPLTRVLNRNSMRTLIRDALQKDNQKKHALFMIDVDNLKQINDRLGHREGDAQLVQFAAAVRDSFRTSDFVGRIGGDEFMVFMRNVSDVEAVRQKARELQQTLRWTVSREGDICISASIGVALFPQDGRTLDELYENADRAMYQVKRNGKNSVLFVQ